AVPVILWELLVSGALHPEIIALALIAIDIERNLLAGVALAARVIAGIVFRRQMCNGCTFSGRLRRSGIRRFVKIIREFRALTLSWRRIHGRLDVRARFNRLFRLSLPGFDRREHCYILLCGVALLQCDRLSGYPR